MRTVVARRAKGVGQPQVAKEHAHEPAHLQHLDRDALQANVPRDPNAMLPYVDHDHVDDKKAADAKKAQAEEKKQLELKINDGKAMAIATHLTVLGQNMNDASSRAFIHELDKIDSPDLRKKVLAQFEAQNGRSLQSFIEGCEDWNNNGENRDKKAALQLISKERDDVQAQIAKMSPEDKQRALDKADEAARQIAAATMSHDHSDENVQKIFRSLGGRNAVEIELIRQRIREQTDGNTNLYQMIDDGMHEGDEDEAIAMLEGNRVGSARAALANETDPARLREVIAELEPEELKLLQMGGYANEILLSRIKNPSDREEIRLLIAGERDKANGERLANLLKFKEDGRVGPLDEVGNDNFKRRKASNVLQEFEGMSAADVKAAAKAWNEKHPFQTFEMMLQARWGDDEDQTEYKRLLAMIQGDKGLNRSLRMQEGIRDEDQEEIEGSLAHQKVDAKELASPDESVRKRAEAVRAENESFERNNREADRQTLQTQLLMQGRIEEAMKLSAPGAVGRSSKDQLKSYYEERKKEDIGTSYKEEITGGKAAELIHQDRQRKHDEKVRDNEVGAMELLEDGKLSPETEIHRGKGDKEKNEALENITSNEELKKAQERYKQKYGKDMLPPPTGDRADMNFHELEMDNVRLYGVRGERPAQVEYLLQAQSYKLTHSNALERSEAKENGGGGTERLRRWQLSAMRKKLKDPKIDIKDPVVMLENGMPLLVEHEGESFDDIQKLLPISGEKVDDGLKEGVSKHEFSQLDKGLSLTNKAQQDAKKRLADRIIKVFSTIAKIAALLTANPALLALINVSEGLLEIAIKSEVMGEAYDPSDDLKKVGVTALAEAASLGIGKLGKLGTAGMRASKVESQIAQAAKIEARYALAGGATKLAIEQVGQGIVQGKPATEILQGLAAGGAGLVIPGHIADKIRAGIGNETVAKKLLAEMMATGGEFVANTTINVAGGADGADAVIDAAFSGAGTHVQAGLAKLAKRASGQNAAPHPDEHATPKTPTDADAHALANGHHAEEPARVPEVKPEHIEAVKAHVEEHAKPKPSDADVHALANGHHAEDAPPSPTAGHAHDTDTGASRLPNQAPLDPSAYRVASNTTEQSRVASERVAKMSKEDRATHAAVIDSLENRAAHVLVERALAAGNSIDQIVRLRDAMKGLDYHEVLRTFSGHGLAQSYTHSCVPTAYQIAIAQRDPVYALHLHENPREMQQGQENALIQTDGRRDPRNYDKAPPALQKQLENPATKAALDSTMDSTGTHGVEPTRMVDTQLHARLEKAAGSKYEVITNTSAKHQHDGAGEFSTFPFDRVNESLGQNRPVLFAQDGHECTITGRELGPDGKLHYVVTDPWTGTTSLVDPIMFSLPGRPIVSITLPVQAKPGEAHETPSQTTKTGDDAHQTHTGGADDLSDGMRNAQAKATAQQIEKDNIATGRENLDLRKEFESTQKDPKLRKQRSIDVDPDALVNLASMDDLLQFSLLLEEGEMGSGRVAVGRGDSRVITSFTQMQGAAIQVKGIGTSKEIHAKLREAARTLDISEQELMQHFANFRVTGVLPAKIRQNREIHALLGRESFRQHAVEPSRISTHLGDLATATPRSLIDGVDGMSNMPADQARIAREQHGAVSSDRTLQEQIRREVANEKPIREGTIRAKSAQKLEAIHAAEAEDLAGRVGMDPDALIDYYLERGRAMLWRTH